MTRSPVKTRGQRGNGMGGHSLPNEGATVEWYTPPGIIDALGLTYDLDPCSPPGGLPWIPAQRHFSRTDDGLSQAWEGRVWMNPPYGTATGQWLERFAEHGDGVALVFARTETEWFQRHALAIDSWLLIRGRLTFVTADQLQAPFNSGAPSMLMAAGERCCEALRGSGLGIYVAVSEKALPAQASIFREST
jgi:hypothetical protein